MAHICLTARGVNAVRDVRGQKKAVVVVWHGAPWRYALLRAPFSFSMKLINQSSRRVYIAPFSPKRNVRCRVMRPLPLPSTKGKLGT